MNSLPSSSDFDGLRALIDSCGVSAAERGFRDEGDRLRAQAAGGDPHAEAALRAYYGNRLMLIVGEVAEAHEELRSGHAIDHAYLNTSAGREGKPEGVPSEIADVVIRAFDLAHEAGIDLASVIESKLAYNATRERMHGKKF